ncbi:hypothetical protein Y032_0293g1604 [Ancylostoma ceylanicum]|uniref:Uncharacterized protein n=1 Tax=Ancylostoma ceylanicum TaxID=53326 RepID=A0A016S4X3_9BILA|nr:hypothetical protein Y032_0293g1604 [Ancylostoma ceylanicum]
MKDTPHQPTPANPEQLAPESKSIGAGKQENISDDLSFPKTPQLVWRSIRQKRHPGRTNARDGGPSLLVSSVCFAMQWM